MATVARNIQSLGFGLSTPLLKQLSTLTNEALSGWYDEVILCLQKIVGAHRRSHRSTQTFRGR